MRFKHILLIFTLFFLVSLQSQSTASKQVTTFSIEAPQLDSVKKIWVYLPKSYQHSEKRYPVVYMHDAQNLFDDSTSYAGEWKIDEYMDTLESTESIIIGIEHGNKKRIDELTPYSHKTYGDGDGEFYLRFIKNTLKPHIDVTYRTLSDADSTTIFGSSLGGLISFYAVIKYPKTFGKAGVFSPAFWINPEIFELVKTNPISENVKFYFLAGTDEGETMIPKLNNMISLLKSKGLNDNQIDAQIIEGGQHNEQFWAEHFGKAYQWLFN
ncbi:alpha/beta hydrolase [Winogradskyella sp.]|uniref:alpha/beta hydrolase n=1 Tax=Winogradskyella sp. TaxID=1883156 RepID=UPI003F6CE8E1